VFRGDFNLSIAVFFVVVTVLAKAHFCLFIFTLYIIPSTEFMNIKVLRELDGRFG